MMTRATMGAALFGRFFLLTKEECRFIDREVANVKKLFVRAVLLSLKKGVSNPGDEFGDRLQRKTLVKTSCSPIGRGLRTQCVNAHRHIAVPAQGRQFFPLDVERSVLFGSPSLRPIATPTAHALRHRQARRAARQKREFD